MDFRELGKRPISDAAPAGAEARQSPEYERLLEETGKLGSLQGAAAVDWNVVVASAADVLEKQAKDIPAAVYLCVGLAHTQGMDGLAAGVRVLADLLACWWDVCFPPLKRLRARANMLSWWHERMAQWLAAAPAAAVPAALRDDLLASLEELDAQLGDRLPDLPPLRDHTSGCVPGFAHFFETAGHAVDIDSVFAEVILAFSLTFPRDIDVKSSVVIKGVGALHGVFHAGKG